MTEPVFRKGQSSDFSFAGAPVKVKQPCFLAEVKPFCLFFRAARPLASINQTNLPRAPLLVKFLERVQGMDKKEKRLRIVCISDTHDQHESITMPQGTLPPRGLLAHFPSQVTC